MELLYTYLSKKEILFWKFLKFFSFNVILSNIFGYILPKKAKKAARTSLSHQLNGLEILLENGLFIVKQAAWFWW